MPQKRKVVVETTMAPAPSEAEEKHIGGYSDREFDPNAVVITTEDADQKRKANDDDDMGESKRKKQKFGRERMMEKQKKKESKAQVKKLQKVLERKRQKETREQLFECLQQYQLPTQQLKALTSTAHRNDKEKISRDEPEQAKDVAFPLKLRSLTGAQITAAEQKPLVQENYYETSDSESEGDMDEEEIRHCIDKYKGKPYRLEEPDSPITVDMKEESSSEDESPATIAPRQDHDDVSDLLGSVPSNLGGIKGDKVIVKRLEEIEASRSKLPIYAEEQQIVEAINENPVVIVSGETGSGKTTQIPQFLYEAGYTSKGHLIGVTEPRRVAAMSMASRVGTELNDPEAVSYQIRFEGNRTEKTKILFMTDGVLMKEMQKDLMLQKYSVIIIDEAHERSMYSDVLIGLLSRIAPMRAETDTPLKLIIMSATLRIGDFTQAKLFPTITPKTIKVESRQFPVTIHFEKSTPQNYLSAAFKKVCKVHEHLPPGAILVFVSGQMEVNFLMKQLEGRYSRNYKRNAAAPKPKETEEEPGKEEAAKAEKDEAEKDEAEKEAAPKEEAMEVEAEAVKDEPEEKKAGKAEPDPKIGDLDEAGIADCEIFDEEDKAAYDQVLDISKDLRNPAENVGPLYCLPLYSLLSSREQQRIFDPVPEGCRLCIVATNVAETSLTIPNVRYVVDTGKEKRRMHDPITGVSMFKVMDISKASAEQRSGRAGRVSAGHAYRLYSSAVFEDLQSFAEPEILNKPVDQLVLHMKSMNIVKVGNFPFPTPPDTDQLEIAETRLLKLGALKVGVTKKSKGKEARITPLGKTLAHFPLSPKYAKMLAMSKQSDLLPYAIAIVSMLSVREPLQPIHSIKGKDDDETRNLMMEALKQRRKWSGTGQCRSLGDLSVLFKAIRSVDGISAEACEKLGLRHKAIVEVRQMQKQLSTIIATASNDPEINYLIATDPTEAQFKMLRQIAVACLPDQIARRVDPNETDQAVPKGAYECQQLQEYVFIDATSVLFKSEPDFILYQDIVKVNDKMCMQNTSIVEAEWLSRLAEGYCHFAPVDDKVDPRFDEISGTVVQPVRTTFGDREWPLGEIDRPLPNNIRLYRYFAQFFLEGKVFTSMAENVKVILATPSVVTKTWAKQQERSERLVNALISHDVRSRDELLAVWRDEQEFLLPEYLAWLPQSYHDRVTLQWPPSN